MPHFKSFYPSEFLQAVDLIEKGLTEFTVTIEKIELEQVPGADGKKKSKPVIHFKGAQKRWPMPKTCAKVIAKKFGTKTEDWIGKKVTLFPTTCEAFGETVECIRLKI